MPTAIDLVADAGGFFAALEVSLVALTVAVQWLFIGLCVLIAVEVARGVMRR